MLRRLDGEDARIQALVSKGELLPEAGTLASQLVQKSRKQLLSELENLQQGFE